MPVKRISKPHLVDFLRMCDRNRWCCPRIRYASIRSKPDLCNDLLKFFTFVEKERLITISPKRPIHKFPRLQYDLKVRSFLQDGKRFDFARISRQKPQFHLVRKTTTLHFGPLYGPPGSGKAAAFALMFP